MNYVIISIYDGMCGFDVLENGEHIKPSREREIALKIIEVSKTNSIHEFLKDYYKDYDLIIISEDGVAEAVKDLTKENQKC